MWSLQGLETRDELQKTLAAETRVEHPRALAVLLVEALLRVQEDLLVVRVFAALAHRAPRRHVPVEEVGAELLAQVRQLLFDSREALAALSTLQVRFAIEGGLTHDGEETREAR